MSHTPISRSSTPSRLHNRASSANIKPKVLPFPDLGSRTSFSMSREPSRATSPIGSPGLASSSNNSTANNSSIAIASQGHYLASSPSSLNVTYADGTTSPPASSSRLAQSASPTNASPLALVTPRPLRPRAATTSAQGSTLAHLLSRNDSFPGPSSRPSTPAAAMATTAVAPVVAVSHTAASTTAAGSSTGLTGILISSSPERSAAPNSAPPRDPSPPRATPRETPRPTPPMPTKKQSNPPNPLPASIAVTPPPPPGTLVEHLHRSFKSGACADVRLWVRKWGVGWHVHKMVLVQAGAYHKWR